MNTFQISSSFIIECRVFKDISGQIYALETMKILDIFEATSIMFTKLEQ